MLDNRLTFFLRKFKFLIIVLLFFSCSKKNIQVKECKNFNKPDVDSRAIMTSASHQLKSIADCVNNYVKFLDDQNYQIQTCQSVRISRTGRVTNAKVFGIDKRIPKDLRMCIEQEMWKMSFKNLQLKRLHQLNFPLNLKTK